MSMILITEKDTTVNETAMARATANTISIVAQMIGNGTITKRGVHPPENIVPGELYIEEMKKRGVVIEETVLRRNDVYLLEGRGEKWISDSRKNRKC